ncbi:TPA: HEAT repeat domain-containing protein [Pseudomonas aeruginosa]|uniref:HEAT repeat domain-containing protein n=1 Tax=Pseudomonas aeruginosa TaxID=287 RepID=UPI001A27C3CB|nr:HEAT repeat domain-containing protein [Pseudomonas aeruginosa]HEB4011204.1 HEAT repeat domain-containing protein [Pseudomonas aeruginosa]HEB4016450.1 HEAT repeat domain-containing protein [Pseudomonas aeruginosa]HEB4024466.1 HEAT repeat domain-containing protein [Pseudomonas aeruginosa]HEK1255974.1 HEAT repeat domain-containing protein [Pseudomonas aeruginosa]
MHWRTRLGAARGLGEAGGDRAIHALRTALKEAPRAEVRGAAAHALGRIAGNLEH